MRHHLKIDHLNANLIQGERSSNKLMIAIRDLALELSHEGLTEIVNALIPEEPLRVSIADRLGSGCVIRVQAMRLGLTPRINVLLSPSPSLQGVILINVDPDNRWSPLDRVMLGVADYNLARTARAQTGLSRLTAGSYQFDLQMAIRDQLLDTHAPVGWDARLDRIDGAEDRIRVEFVSVV